METYNITLRNPKAKGLLKEMEELNLITMKKSTNSRKDLIKLLDEMRTRNSSTPTVEEISKEVKAVRKKRYGKK